MKVYMEITKDEYQLPVAVADTVKDLAKKIGTRANSISSALCKQRKGVRIKSRYIEVELDEEDECGTN